MLLVDDREPELLELHTPLHQRMRPDDQRDRARGDFGELVAPRRGRGRSGQQRDPKPRLLQEPGDVAEVLLGEDLGRRHERDLQTVLHRDERRQQRHDRLAGPDVALQQPVHRLRPLHVLDDLFQRRPLAVRQLERQHAARRLANAIVHENRFGFRSAAADRRRAITPI